MHARSACAQFALSYLNSIKSLMRRWAMAEGLLQEQIAHCLAS
jgi:hypothetical protein